MESVGLKWSSQLSKEQIGWVGSDTPAQCQRHQSQHKASPVGVQFLHSVLASGPAAGSYSSGEGSVTCAQCSPGQMQEKSGGTACKACPKDRCEKDHVHCEPCPGMADLIQLLCTLLPHTPIPTPRKQNLVSCTLGSVGVQKVFSQSPTSEKAQISSEHISV